MLAALGLSSPTCQTGLSVVQLTLWADLGFHLYSATYGVALGKSLHLSEPRFLIGQTDLMATVPTTQGAVSTTGILHTKC